MTLREVMERDARERHAERVRREVLRLGLKRTERFDDLDARGFAAIYNGYGPDSWPEGVRQAVTLAYRNWECVAAVHDVDYHFSDGTREGWEAATERWRVNSGIALEARYPLGSWWLWGARAAAWSKLRGAWQALRAASWGAWVSASRKWELMEG